MSQDFGKYLYYSTDKAVEIYEKLNQYAIREIVRRLVRTGYLNKAVTNIIYKMQEAGMTMQAIIEAVARHSGMTENEVKKAFEDAAIEASREDTETYRQAGIKQNTVLTSEVMKNALKTAILQTNNELRNITRTMAQKSQVIFIEAVDEAYMKVQSGMCTYETAIAEAITEVSKNGLYVKYPSGHRDTIETAVRRALMTGLNQGTMRMKIAKMKEMGQDLLVTSQHVGARTGGKFPYEYHSKWQGKVFSISGQSHKYPSFTEECGWGKGGGIGGWNCRHHIYAYIEGVSKLPEPIDEEENRRVEELNKKQRRYESSIRAKKRELLGLKEGMEATDSDKLKFELQQQYDRSAYELRELNKNYNDFCSDNNLKTWNERKKVVDFQREQSYEARLGADRYKKIPHYLGADSGIREYTEEQIKTMANEMKQVADKHIERESKWSGNIVVDNKDKRTGKLWNCDIQVTGKTSPHIILHEQIHAKSISYYDKETYCEYGKIEEAVVQYLTQEISKKEEITIINSMYDNDVKMLRKIREKLSFTSDYEFAKTLIDILVSERIQWIENKVYDKMLLSGTLEEYEEMAEIINKLGGNE